MEKVESRKRSLRIKCNKGMVCDDTTKKCKVVPSDYFGPIPGVVVGKTWMSRIQLSEAGVHLPIVGGIHGHNKAGALSILLSGCYEDDFDNGDEILYTGSGGRTSFGNRNTTLQTSDQELTKINLTLALNCKAAINTTEGATAENWKLGRPVRVIRSNKLPKHSIYTPEFGYRYDGIYKVVKYYPEIGKSGFKVWKFSLRRDDPTPAPWTEEGKLRICKLGLSLKCPKNDVPPIATVTTLQNSIASTSGTNQANLNEIK